MFAGLYLWNTQPLFADRTASPARLPGLLALGLGVWALGWRADRVARAGAFRRAAGLDLALAASALATAACLAWALLPVDLWSSAFAAVGWALAAFVAVHLAVVAY